MPAGDATCRRLLRRLRRRFRSLGSPFCLLASTDLNHYEDQETSHIKDKLVLDAILKLDEDALMGRVVDVEVSMCGVAATYIVLHAAKKLGAKRAELLDYRTSGRCEWGFYAGGGLWRGGD